MQTPIRNFEESKQITAGAMTPFNVNCYDVIRDLVVEFTNNGSPATLADCLSSINRVVVLINGMSAVDVKLSQIVDLFTFLGTRVNQTTLTNVFSLNMGRLLYNAGLLRDEFAWRCGKLGTTDPTKKISSLVVQIYAGTTVRGITDVNLYSLVELYGLHGYSSPPCRRWFSLPHLSHRGRIFIYAYQRRSGNFKQLLYYDPEKHS